MSVNPTSAVNPVSTPIQTVPSVEPVPKPTPKHEPPPSKLSLADQLFVANPNQPKLPQTVELTSNKLDNYGPDNWLTNRKTDKPLMPAWATCLMIEGASTAGLFYGQEDSHKYRAAAKEFNMQDYVELHSKGPSKLGQDGNDNLTNYVGHPVTWATMSQTYMEAGHSMTTAFVMSGVVHNALWEYAHEGILYQASGTDLCMNAVGAAAGIGLYKLGEWALEEGREKHNPLLKAVGYTVRPLHGMEALVRTVVK